ncbi:MAG TPA: 16S rRNA (adenine(1518)-N(6)/adenine(1519)-N(6))-dimethyltransferase RsmA [Candidatus Udaeobacter sp.]|nr:16S rRNA (adenine(1518)-N(6)/adenine(1519)-N(6))-dimethyltransferase RsmA [Candidatus Udaeobacter sp.]
MSSLYNTDYLQHLCKKYGLIPSKKYGQNFLINEEVIDGMIVAGDLKKDDLVVEVGPGFGVLTLALAEKVKKVITFEIEKRLESYWSEETERIKNIEVVWGNVLKQDINFDKYKVVANLPYQITANVIRKFLEAANKPESMVLMVQKEVAERICAVPGDMSILAVSVQYYAEPEIVIQVPRSYFWPVPGVDSAVIKLTIKKNTESDKEFDDRFFKLVKAGFANRRKMLLKNLGSVIDKKKLPAIFQELGINDKVRAQELSVEQWRGLAVRVGHLSP